MNRIICWMLDEMRFLCWAFWRRWEGWRVFHSDVGRLMMGSLCRLFGHKWEEKWRTLSWPPAMICLCTRCGAVGVHRCLVR